MRPADSPGRRRRGKERDGELTNVAVKMESNREVSALRFPGRDAMAVSPLGRVLTPSLPTPASASLATDPVVRGFEDRVDPLFR